jgi:bifunctional non-homologous end joining protein LigD
MAPPTSRWSPASHAVATLLIARDHEHLTQEFVKADRGGRILIDIGRNGPGATYAAPYAVRARPHAPVSAPCTWEEIERGEVAPQTFTLRGMQPRLDAAGDLWSGLHAKGRSLRHPLAQLEKLLPEGAHFEAAIAAQAAARQAAMRAGHARWLARGRTE